MPKRIRKADKKSITFVQKKSHTPRTKAFWLGVLLVGMLFQLTWVIGKRYFSLVSLSTNPGVAALEQEVVGPKTAPKQVLILNKVGVGLAAVPLTQGRWQVPEEEAAYLVGSGLPGSGGNIVVYGHNKDSIFGGLKKVEVGEIVRLVTDEGTYEYAVTHLETVEPTAVEWLEPTEAEVLTLYTCTGFLDSKRLIVRAERLM